MFTTSVPAFSIIYVAASTTQRQTMLSPTNPSQSNTVKKVVAGMTRLHIMSCLVPFSIKTTGKTRT